MMYATNTCFPFAVSSSSLRDRSASQLDWSRARSAAGLGLDFSAGLTGAGLPAALGLPAGAGRWPLVGASSFFASAS